ncbi:MAG TPA: sulfite exporter TauE/SafE family protein [Burkholderiales bacterium]|nr:sulfite exporter TauE/SafE family protein [Burkholderiales bacterium]
MHWWLAYVAIGALAGFIAGLLGIGGGAVIVPLLVFAFTAQGVPESNLLHLALATTMATIIFTSLSSARAHHSHGSVDWTMARIMMPGMLAGAFVAALIAGMVPTRPLAITFTALIFVAATQVVLDLRPKTTRALPGPAGVFAAASLIGAISSLLAVGGAFLTIPFLAWCNVPLRRAIGTAAANGFPIALAGTAAYVLQGWRVPGLPEGSLGYVYLPALALIAASSMLTAPAGAKLAHRMPVKKLRILLALILYALAIRLLVRLW